MPVDSDLNETVSEPAESSVVDASELGAGEFSAGGSAANSSESPWLHWFFLILGIVVIGLSLLLVTPDDLEVTIAGQTIPEICTMKRLTDVGCPGCGMTRAFICISGGHFTRAWYLNPASFLMYLFVAIQIPYRIFQLVRLRMGRTSWPESWFGWSFLAIGILMLIQWVLKLVGLF